MNRTYFYGIALGIAVLGIALLGNQKRAVAGDCCAPAVCARPATPVPRPPATRSVAIGLGPASRRPVASEGLLRREGLRPATVRRRLRSDMCAEDLLPRALPPPHCCRTCEPKTCCAGGLLRVKACAPATCAPKCCAPACCEPKTCCPRRCHRVRTCRPHGSRSLLCSGRLCAPKCLRPGHLRPRCCQACRHQRCRTCEPKTCCPAPVRRRCCAPAACPCGPRTAPAAPPAPPAPKKA